MALTAPEPEQTPQQIAENMATYEELAHLEQEFDDVDCEVIRTNYRLSAPLYKKRQAIISKIPSFWALVVEQAPQDLDQFITPSDSQVIAQALTNLEITRPEVDEPNGDPRSITIKLSFKDNDYFDDKTLEKTFYFRRAEDNWTGHVSQPTKIHWKKGKDLTKGLTDAAYNLWQKKAPAHPSAASNGDAKPLPEEAALRRKLETLGEESTSFFTFFAFVSERRYVSAEESADANKAEKARRQRRAAGEEVEDVKPADDGFEEQDFEVCPHGAELAMVLAEDVWPHAIKYFVTGQELDDDEDMEDFSDEEEDSDDEDGRVDIRALVQGKRKDKSSQSLSPVGIDKPPAKKQQKKK